MLGLSHFFSILVLKSESESESESETETESETESNSESNSNSNSNSLSLWSYNNLLSFIITFFLVLKYFSLLFSILTRETKDKIKEILLSRNAHSETVLDFINLTENCDFARYAPSTSVTIQQDYDKAIEIISNLEKQISWPQSKKLNES